jgi:hypothetical protein
MCEEGAGSFDPSKHDLLTTVGVGGCTLGAAEASLTYTWIINLGNHMAFFRSVGRRIKDWFRRHFT